MAGADLTGQDIANHTRGEQAGDPGCHPREGKGWIGTTPLKCLAFDDWLSIVYPIITHKESHHEVHYGA